MQHKPQGQMPRNKVGVGLGFDLADRHVYIVGHCVRIERTAIDLPPALPALALRNLI
jgi:hypothetical protein